MGRLSPSYRRRERHFVKILVIWFPQRLLKRFMFWGVFGELRALIRGCRGALLWPFATFLAQGVNELLALLHQKTYDAKLKKK